MELRQYNKPYHTDHSIVYSCQYHVIFYPKYRRKVLTGTLTAHIKKLVLAKQEAYNYTIIAMEVQPDHVHLLLDVDPRVKVNSVVGKLKKFTSHELQNKFP